MLATCLIRGTIVPERPLERPRNLYAPWGREATVATYEAYCVKCRAKREFEGTEVELKNGRKAAQGTCPVCGTKVMRILGKSSA
jgi:hypothetical protein